MSVCWKCPLPASEAYTWRLPNGRFDTRYFCKIHSPYTKPLKREYPETTNEVIDEEANEEELEAFARKKAEDLEKNDLEESL